MDGLRWLLLIFGVLVIAGVYFYSRREQVEDEKPPEIDRKTPTIDEQADELAEEAAVEQPDIDEAESPEVARDEQKIVTLRLVARDRDTFPAEDLILNMRGIGLRHGKFGIFHRIDGDDEGRTIFSAASLVEPGSFDLKNLKDQEIPGISLFLVLPGPIDGVDAFDMMMQAARTMAQSLDGELLDESGSTLSIQRERYMREEVVQFEHSHKVA